MAYTSQYSGAQIDRAVGIALNGSAAKAENKVIIGRSIPEYPMIGARYFFRDGIVKIRKVNGVSVSTSLYISSGNCYVRTRTYGCPIIFTITEDYDWRGVLTGTTDIDQFVTKHEGYTGETTSPDYVVEGGAYVCVKSLNYRVSYELKDLVINTSNFVYRFKKHFKKKYAPLSTFVHRYHKFIMAQNRNNHFVFEVVPCSNKWKKINSKRKGRKQFSRNRVSFYMQNITKDGNTYKYLSERR